MSAAGRHLCARAIVRLRIPSRRCVFRADGVSGGRRRTVCIGSTCSGKAGNWSAFPRRKLWTFHHGLCFVDGLWVTRVDFNTCRDEGQLESDVSDSDGSDGTDSSIKTEDMPTEVASQLL